VRFQPAEGQMMDEAYRLTFEHEDGGLTLKSVRKVTMRVPRGQRGDAAAQVGRFVELRGDGGEPLYRRQVTDIASRTVEYPTGDPERPFGRTEARRGVVTVLVPADEAARSVALVEVSASGEHKGAGLRATAEAAEAAPQSRDLITVDLPRGEEAS